MNEALPLWKKILTVILLGIAILFVCYFIGSCSLISGGGKLNLTQYLQNEYSDKDNKYKLTFDSEKSLALICPEKAFSSNEVSFLLEIEEKGNIFFAHNEDENFVFIPLSEDRIYLQTRNVILYNIDTFVVETSEESQPIEETVDENEEI